MQEEAKKTKTARNSNLILLLVSVALSFLLWLVLSLFAFPDMETSFKDVPIDFSLAGSYADVANISIMSKSVETANVRFSGQRYLIGKYTADDIHIGVNLDPVRATGSYELSLVVTSRNGDPIDVLQIEPATVRVDFDYMIYKTFSVEEGTLNADISSISAAPGYIIDPSEVVISPSSVELYGPKDYIDQITSCSVAASNNSVVQSTLTTSNTSLVMHNGSATIPSGAVQEGVTVTNAESFELTVPVYFRKDLNLDIGITKIFDQFDLSSLSYRIEPSSVAVRSQNEAIKEIDEITLGYIDLNRINIGSVFQIPIANSSYYTNISGNDTAYVYFDLEGYSTKQVTLRNSQIYVINKPENMRVNVEQDKIRNVTLVGPTEIIEQLDYTDVVAQIDMLDYQNTEGNYAMFVLTIFVPQHNNVWCFGTYQVTCSVEQDIDTFDIDE